MMKVVLFFCKKEFRLDCINIINFPTSMNLERFSIFIFTIYQNSNQIIWKQLSSLLQDKFSSPSENLEQIEELKTYLEEFPDNEKIENKEVESNHNQLKESLFNINSRTQESTICNELIINKEENNGDKISDNNDEEDEFMEVNISNFDNLEIDSLSKPKHLYDCLLGLRSENKERLEQSLKYLAYLIRKNLEDLEVLSEDLINVLLRISGDSEEFQANRKKAICALVIMEPEKISK